MPNLKEIIEKDITNKKGKYNGRVLYYKKGHVKYDQIKDIVNRNNQVETIQTKNTAEIYINYMKVLVDQKIDYLLAKDATINKNDYFEPFEITDMIQEMSFNAALDSVAWLHLYVNKESRLDWIYVLDKEIIPIYDSYHKKIIEVIRYFRINDEKIQVEHWTIDGVTKVIMNNEFNIEKQEELSHYVVVEMFENGNVQSEEPKNLPFIPFIPLFNNRAIEADSEGIEDLLFLYASISSGLVDNIDRFQEAITKLKGFTSDKRILQETMDNMKKYKAVGVPSDGDIELEKIEIPIEARAFILDLIKTAVFLIGKGMNPQQTGDGNITNVVITSRYSELDTKCNNHEKQLKKFYKNFIGCLNEYYSILLPSDIILNRSMIFNLTEKIQNAIDSKGLVSLKTALSMHPNVDDVDKEIYQLMEENKSVNPDTKPVDKTT